MSLVRVFGNTYLNPDCVGKLTFDAKHSSERRTSLTKVFDVTGECLLLEAETVVLTSALESDPDRVRRDNHVHREIVAALNARRDARSWEDRDEPDPTKDAAER